MSAKRLSVVQQEQPQQAASGGAVHVSCPPLAHTHARTRTHAHTHARTHTRTHARAHARAHKSNIHTHDVRDKGPGSAQNVPGLLRCRVQQQWHVGTPHKAPFCSEGTRRARVASSRRDARMHHCTARQPMQHRPTHARVTRAVQEMPRSSA